MSGDSGGETKVVVYAALAGINQVVLLADNDAGGRRAVALAQDGLQRDGLVLRELWPPERCNDWADVLSAERGEGAEPG